MKASCASSTASSTVRSWRRTGHYTFIWKKSTDRLQQRVQEQAKAILREVEQANAAEEAAFGERERLRTDIGQPRFPKVPPPGLTKAHIEIGFVSIAHNLLRRAAVSA